MRSTTIKKFMAMREALVKEKAALEARLAEINEALGVASETTAAPAAPAPKRRGRPAGKKKAVAKVKRVGARRGPRAKNKLTLKHAALAAVSKKALKAKEIIAAVKKQGYKFSAGNPLNSLNAMLYSNKKTFKSNKGVFSPA